MVRREPANNPTAGINTNRSTMFTLLLKLHDICDCEQRWIQFELQNSPSSVLYLMAKYALPFSTPVKSDHNQNFWYFQNNHIKTTKVFSVRSSADPPILKKIAVRSNVDTAKIGNSPDPLLVRANLCCVNGFRVDSCHDRASFVLLVLRASFVFSQCRIRIRMDIGY